VSNPEANLLGSNISPPFSKHAIKPIAPTFPALQKVVPVVPDFLHTSHGAIFHCVKYISDKKNVRLEAAMEDTCGTLDHA
jgi:hypothetical protein